MRRYRIVWCLLWFGMISGIYAQKLDVYLEEAAQNNPGLQAKYIQFEAAMQQVAQVSALPNPTFSFGVFIRPVETRVGPQWTKFSLSQMFPWFGTLGAKGEWATRLAEAKFQEFLNARNELFFNVKSAWYPLYELHQTTQLQEENLEILTHFKQLATNSFKNGKGNMVDVLRVDLMIDQAQTEIQLLKEKRKPLLTRFNNLLNRVDTLSVVIIDSLWVPKVAKNYRKDSLLSTHPLLTALDLKLQAAQARETVARKQSLPQWGVGLDYVVVGKRTDMEVKGNGKDILMPMLSVSLPVFRGKYKAAIQEAALSQSAITAVKQNFENELLSNYEMSLYELKRSAQMLDLYQNQIEKTNQMITLLLSAYTYGGKDFEEILRMQQQLLTYQIAEAVAIKDYFTALAKLDFLTSKTE